MFLKPLSIIIRTSPLVNNYFLRANFAPNSIRKLSLKNLSFFGLQNSLYRENVLLSAHSSPKYPGRPAFLQSTTNTTTLSTRSNDGNKTTPEPILSTKRNIWYVFNPRARTAFSSNWLKHRLYAHVHAFWNRALLVRLSSYRRRRGAAAGIFRHFASFHKARSYPQGRMDDDIRNCHSNFRCMFRLTIQRNKLSSVPRRMFYSSNVSMQLRYFFTQTAIVQFLRVRRNYLASGECFDIQTVVHTEFMDMRNEHCYLFARNYHSEHCDFALR